MEKMQSVAIITARGGSKRIPKKNIKEFCGKPIIAYSIEAALTSGVFDEVMVSTDSEEIKEIAEKYGAVVPFLRSAETSNDYATTADVLEEVINNYKRMGKNFDSFACIYPTAPFVTGAKLAEALELLNSADAVLSVVKYSFPPQRAFIIREGNVAFQYPEFERTRSQDLEPIYHDCGQFYICRVEPFLAHHSLILPVTKPCVLPEEQVQDIDTMSDWEIAEAKYQVLHKGE
jgi:N-acylneuraminate cytidylyltransferase